MNHMKRTILLLAFLIAISGCKNYSSEYQQCQQELTVARDSIKTLLATVEALSYPADQRLANVNSFIKNKDYVSATKEVDDLVRLFPNSTEAKSEAQLRNIIEAGIQAQIAEAERIKALGFKVLSEKSKVDVEDVSLSFGAFKTASEFTFDSYSTYSGSEWRYLQADKGSKYISVPVSITSKNTNPKLPQCAVYTVNGDKLTLYGTFMTKLARWDDYGSYLGNDADFNNDFAKVNTVKFKLGIQVDEEILKKPFVVLLRNQCALSRNENRYNNPPISYVGSCGFEQEVTVDSIQAGNYTVIKKYNFNLL